MTTPFGQGTLQQSASIKGVALICAYLAFCTYSILGSANALSDQVPVALLLSALCAYCVIVIWQEYVRGQLFSPLSLYFASVLIHFGISGLLYPDVGIFASPHNYPFFVPALLFITGFSLIYHLTYRILAHNHISDENSHLNLWRVETTWLAILSLVAIGIVGRALILHWNVYLQVSLSTYEGAQNIQFLGTVRQFELFPNYATYIALIAHFAARDRGNYAASRAFGIIAAVLVVANILYWLPTGKKFPTISTALVPLIIYYIYNARLPRARYIAVMGVFVAAIFPLTHIYRVTQAQMIAGKNVGDISSTIAAISEAVARAPTANEIGARNRIFGRLNQIEPVAASIRILDEKIAPPRYGQDYLNVATNMVPGFLWPNKPKVMYGNEFGHWAQMIKSSDPFTAISVTLIGEAYLNFHIAGIFVGALLAAIYASFYRFNSRIFSRESSTLIYAGAAPTILYIGASFALYISAIIQTSLVLVVISVFMQQSGSRAAHPPGRGRP